MHAFLCEFTPRSVNAKQKVAYYSGLITAYRKYHGSESLVSGTLYGVVYYFHRVKTELDADNLSKPIWDALHRVAFDDDKQIRHRTSGIFDLNAEAIEVLDLSGFPDYLIEDFLKLIDENSNHILYIEFGTFDYDRFKFGLENGTE